jgi:hypothetical protein
MSDAEFDPKSLDRGMPQSAQDAVLLLVRAWPLYEAALTDWLTAVAGMKREIGAFFIGRMDTRGKISKLKEIYQHLGDKRQAQWLTNLNRTAKDYTHIRNVVIHTIYLGHRPSPDKEGQYELIYSEHRPVKGKPSTVSSLIVRLDDIKKAATFAGRAAQKINNALGQQGAAGGPPQR